MRPAVVTAVLLLLCILDTVTARPRYDPNQSLCQKYPKKYCGDGWRHIAGDRCAKFFWAKKSHDEAEEHCKSLGGDLVSIHNEEDMNSVLCLTYGAGYPLLDFWFGLKRSGDQNLGWAYTDNTEYGYNRWHRGEPNNVEGQENCVMSNFNEWGYWKNADCSLRKYFVCAKKK